MQGPSPSRIAARHLQARGNFTRLVMFDFDGTLFRADDETPSWWRGPPHSWSTGPAALNEPCVPERPGPEYWIDHAVDAARAATRDATAFVVLVTGRVQRHQPRILELLRSKGIVPDAVFFNPGMKVTTYKTRVFSHLIVRYPYIQALDIWENENQAVYDAWARAVSEKLGRPITVTVHAVDETPMPLLCGPADFGL